MLTLESVDIAGKRVVIRVDLNVPLADGQVANDERIRATLPTIQYCLDREAEVVLVSHLGRPQSRVDPRFSLQPVSQHLSQLFERKVRLVVDWQDEFLNDPSNENEGVVSGRISLIENIRFDPREEQNDSSLGSELARVGDIYVMDAFGTAHRAHASTSAAIQCASLACAGPLLAQELESLERVMLDPKRPLIAVVGGAKISGKLEALVRLSEVADTILVGGGMANTFLLAKGNPVGRSLVEEDLTDMAVSIMERTDVPLPIDAMTCTEIAIEKVATLRSVNEVRDTDTISDIGPRTARDYAARLQHAQTIVWNGPMGVFEFDQFGEGTRVVGEAIATSSAYTLAGGGDTIAAMENYGLKRSMSYVSTGGGAFLAVLEGKELPSVRALKVHSHQHSQA